MLRPNHLICVLSYLFLQDFLLLLFQIVFLHLLIDLINSNVFKSHYSPDGIRYELFDINVTYTECEPDHRFVEVKLNSPLFIKLKEGDKGYKVVSIKYGDVKMTTKEKPKKGLIKGGKNYE